MQAKSEKATQQEVKYYEANKKLPAFLFLPLSLCAQGAFAEENITLKINKSLRCLILYIFGSIRDVAE